MRVQSACLLLLCAAVLSQTYNDFERKHILLEKSSEVNYDNMMKNINGNNKCKEINSVIKARVEEINVGFAYFIDFSYRRFTQNYLSLNVRFSQR